MLHHPPDPNAGFDALAAALAPDGWIGFMVYAPYGWDGSHPLQEAFRALLPDDSPQAQVALAREALAALPDTNGFRRNSFVSDHEASDAGFFDLLLHSRDRLFTVEALPSALDHADLGLVSFLEPLRQDPAQHLPRRRPSATVSAA